MSNMKWWLTLWTIKAAGYVYLSTWAFNHPQHSAIGYAFLGYAALAAACGVVALWRIKQDQKRVPVEIKRGGRSL